MPRWNCALTMSMILFAPVGSEATIRVVVRTAARVPDTKPTMWPLEEPEDLPLFGCGAGLVGVVG